MKKSSRFHSLRVKQPWLFLSQVDVFRVDSPRLLIHDLHQSVLTVLSVVDGVFSLLHVIPSASLAEVKAMLVAVIEYAVYIIAFPVFRLVAPIESCSVAFPFLNASHLHKLFELYFLQKVVVRVFIFIVACRAVEEVAELAIEESFFIVLSLLTFFILTLAPNKPPAIAAIRLIRLKVVAFLKVV